MTKTPVIVYLVGLAAISAQSSASAQDGVEALPENRPELVEKLFDCRVLENDGERLACYDREVAAVEEAEEADELVIADREQIKEAKRGLFGFKLPRIGLFDRSSDGEDEEREVSSIEAIIGSSSRNWQGQLSFVLEDGARWRQTDKTQVYGDIEKGTRVTIERAALGSYKAKIGRKRAFRVERVN